MITWYAWVHPTDQARFRMAAAGDVETGQIHFVGGSHQPYHFNGTGFDGSLAKGSDEVWTYNVDTRSWKLTTSPNSSTDHRGLIKVGDSWLTIGGMLTIQSKDSDQPSSLEATHRVLEHLSIKR